MRRALHDLALPIFVVKQDDGWGIATSGTARFGEEPAEGLPVIAYAPAMRVSQLGDASFCADHGIRFSYMTGAMANGIASAEVVIAAAQAGCLGSFGAAGLRVTQIDAAIERLQRELPDLPFCFNLIHSPNEMSHEMSVVELYLRRGVRLVEAAAFLDLTLPAVLYRVSGIHQGADGEIVAPNRIIAKVSRVEVATKWFSPAPEKMLSELVGMGKITAEQAEMAAGIPMAQDLTAEADSAGHTDNRPALTLLPTMLALRDRLQEQFGYDVPLRVGLGGGIGTPSAAAAAFAMGAAYVVTGSVNQACAESGSSDKVRGMLAQVQQADVIMAPAADMFEMGVKLQVIKRGTMFPMRAAKLHELYRAYGSIEEIPATEREAVEKTIFRESLVGIWEKTKAFFREIDPSHIERAERDSKHKMALVFRWYLGLSSRWANAGEASRVVDYQVWCGPAMGAFNEWTKGTFLEEPANRRVGVVAMNLLHGAAVTTRLNALRSQGVRMDAELARVGPVMPGAIEDQLR
jgi:trans-AT polyketide synthase/acyltransferase/oxidoreductase domain-containing protein